MVLKIPHQLHPWLVIYFRMKFSIVILIVTSEDESFIGNRTCRTELFELNICTYQRTSTTAIPTPLSLPIVASIKQTTKPKLPSSSRRWTITAK
jgi:hypothetical protein